MNVRYQADADLVQAIVTGVCDVNLELIFRLLPRAS
jgi:hypothetical protein